MNNMVDWKAINDWIEKRLIFYVLLGSIIFIFYLLFTTHPQEQIDCAKWCYELTNETLTIKYNACVNICLS